MRIRTTMCALFLLCPFLLGPVVRAQVKAAAQLEPKVVTVPASIDHNRVVIDVDVPLTDGSVQRVHAWVDNGNPELEMSRRLARVLKLNVTCDDKSCSSPPPAAIVVGGMTVPLGGPNGDGVKLAKIPLRAVSTESVLAAGMNVEINIPSTVLRHHDVLVDFPGHKFTIGTPGTIHFLGSSSKAEVNAENGLIQMQSRIENKKYNLALDLGSPISFLSGELFDKLATAHADWPHMTGAVGSANMWGAEEEPKWRVMRVDRLQFGPLFLTDVPVVDFPAEGMEFFAKRAGVPSAGLIGSQALVNYRVGLDYSHATVYFDIGRLFNFPDFDVVGIVLRAEDDGRFTILGAADIDGKPSVLEGGDGVQAGDSLVAVNDIAVRGATLGQVWSMLGGTPGQERKLAIERAGKQHDVVAHVQHFLAELPDDSGSRKRK